MKISYKQSGVDLQFANAIVPKIEKLVRRTRRPEVLADIGLFGSLFQLKKYKFPVLVASADGVGTKLSMALALKNFNTIGIDLVAMNANDILAMGAEPLFFLDYIGIGKDHKKFLPKLIQSIARGCEIAGCSLVGGETAEMPGTYGGKRLGFSGFAVGVVEKDHVITGESIQDGDIILGFVSSGLHSNGFSLVNKIFKPNANLLTPTRIYVKSVLPLLKRFPIHGLAHITGGGLYDNIRRILPKYVDARIDKKSWDVPKIFSEIQSKAHLSEKEMFHIFNMGIGFVVIAPYKYGKRIIASLGRKERVVQIGVIEKGKGKIVLS